MMRPKLLIPMLLTLFLTGCSTFNFFFDHLPFFTSWQMDRMLDLDENQEQIVEQGAEEVQQWFIKEGFPLWIERLEKANSLWINGEHKTAARYLDEGIQTSLDEFLEAVRPRLLPLLLTLTEKNAKRYREYNDDKKDDWFEYSLSDEDKQDARIDKLYEWFGPLRDSQSQAAKDIVVLFPNEREIRYANNDHWKEQVLSAVLNRDKDILEQWLIDPSIWWLPEYAQLREQNRQQRNELVEMMIETMSTKQFKRVSNYVQDWIDRLKDTLD